MLVFKTFDSARYILRGNIELMRMIKKGQMVAGGGGQLSVVGRFYMIGRLKHREGSCELCSKELPQENYFVYKISVIYVRLNFSTEPDVLPYFFQRINIFRR
jgi:hypothetical protein